MSSVSNGLYFLTLPLVSVMRVFYRKYVMRVIYTSKRMSKKFGVRVIYRKIQYFEFMFLALGIQHAPYCHVWPVCLYRIFPHYIMKGKIKKKIFNIQWEFCFSVHLCLIHLHLILKITERNVITNICRSSCKIAIILVGF